MSRKALINEEIDIDTLAFAIARNHCGAREPVEAILAAEGVPLDRFLKLADNPLFKSAVKRYTKELNENGTSFQLKARLQAEELLKRQYVLIHDPETPAAVAVKAIENTVRWAGLEPKTTAGAAQIGGSAGFQIIFNLNSAEKPEKVIENIAIEAA